MKTLLDIDTTAALNGRVGINGEMAIDSEKEAVRYFDGQTPGGFEASLMRAYDPPLGPGPETLIGGDMTAGYYGLVPSTSGDLPYGNVLASAIGLSAGTLHNTTVPYLKFVYNGKIYFIASKTFAYGLTWSNISNTGGRAGDATVTANTYQYKVWLPTDELWDALMYKVSVDDPTGTFWASLSDAELGLDKWSYGYWPQGYARGGGGNITNVVTFNATATGSATGWRPVLELVV